MSDRFDPILLSELIASHKRQIANLGVVIRYNESFEELEEALPIDAKHSLTPHFSTALNTYTSANAFWLGGFDADNQLVALSAARLDDLGAQSMSDYLKRYWRRCYPAADGDPAEACETQPRFWNEVRGRVAYYGDFHLKREGYQGRGLPKLFGPLAMLVGAQKWDADWYYTWVRERDWSMRYPLAYGFSRTYFPGLRWGKPPSSIEPDLAAGVNSRSDVLDWMETLSRPGEEA
jgi:hypothetical protein